ncbi:hypothetical protein BXO88_13885 [Oribacterium sp. C9]|uniref:hypothetical protein n=1 Tax=Oribacterium sp. C9 TaxID=1943579 RepID=UPI00098FC0F6|nr:hypothetical protein [Oribacterium sp. C9]OON85151.1 hypothetical protein BXO88_13885 [Oribacterium sp. C9]
MSEKMQFFRANVFVNVCMALSINTAATILSGGDTLSGFVRGCCCAFTINTVAAVILPMGSIGSGFSEGICRQKKGSFGEMLSRNFIVNAIYVTIVSFCMAMINAGIGKRLIAVWFSTYPALHLVGLVTSLVIENLSKKLNKNN